MFAFTTAVLISQEPDLMLAEPVEADISDFLSPSVYLGPCGSQNSLAASSSSSVSLSANFTNVPPAAEFLAWKAAVSWHVVITFIPACNDYVENHPSQSSAAIFCTISSTWSKERRWWIWTAFSRFGDGQEVQEMDYGCCNKYAGLPPPFLSTERLVALQSNLTSTTGQWLTLSYHHCSSYLPSRIICTPIRVWLWTDFTVSIQCFFGIPWFRATRPRITVSFLFFTRTTIFNTNTKWPATKDGYIYGFFHFTQKRDRSSRRGYFQVLIHLFVYFFFYVVSTLFWTSVSRTWIADAGISMS
jgi:hypothetical protein